jgi:hypothetical protein
LLSSGGESAELLLEDTQHVFVGRPVGVVA